MQLGIPHGTANGRLRKIVLFELLKRHNENICFQCGKFIENVEEFSVEHKVPWLDSENPTKLFFDIDNIAFSHLRCNIVAAKRTVSPHGTQGRYQNHKCRCLLCKEAHAKQARLYR